ncbi:MAG: HlyD family type I secretion periplasmic adaptor subunit [Elainellaceae cyanobacterium]
MRLVLALNHSSLTNRSLKSSDTFAQSALPIHDLYDLEVMLVEHEAGAIYGGSASLEKPTHWQPRTVQNQPKPPEPQSSSGTQWSPTLQNVLDQPPSQLPARLIVVGLLFCCVFGAWAWFGRIQEVSRAQGRLVPEGEVYKVQPVTQGEIAQILVKEGQPVQAGQIVAILDHRLAEAEVDRLEQSLTSYQLQRTQIQGQIEQTRLEMKTQRSIIDAATQAQEAAIVQAKSKATTAQQMIAHLQAETAAYGTRLSRLQPLVDEGALAQEHLFDVEQSVREYERMITQNQGDMEQSWVEAEQLQAGLLQKRAEGEQTELETQQRLQQLAREAAEIEAKITETQALLKAAETKLEQMYLYAPVSGVISALHIKNVGEVTQPSQTIAEIAPEGAPLVLSATLPNREAGLVKEGMPVQIKFDAFPYQQYGITSGQVVSISPDARIDEQLGAVYELEVALEPDANVDRGIQFKAGQTASAEIVTQQRRVIDILLDPVKKLQGGVNL